METKLLTYKSIYDFIDFEDGFEIKDTKRNGNVIIRLNEWKTGFNISRLDENPTETSLIEVHKIILTSVKFLQNTYDEYYKNQISETNKKEKSWAINGSIRKWQSVKTGKALAKRISKRIRALWIKANQEALALQRRIFSLVGPKNYEIRKFELIRPEFYKKHKLWINDLNTYPAAGLWFVIRDRKIESKDWMKLYLQREPIDWEGRVQIYNSILIKPYKNLTKTLQKIRNVRALSTFIYYGINYQLLRPYENNTEFTLLTRCMDKRNAIMHKDVLLKSDLSQFKRAIKLVARTTHQKVDFRRIKSTVENCLSYILDCDEPHNGEIVGLAEKSIRWHRTTAERKLKEEFKDKERKLVVPPIPLPQDNRIKFLATGQDLMNESIEMNHCVRSYIKYASSGDCYLFSVAKDGERATVEVDKNGFVKQSRGPSNLDNKASKWAYKELNRWGEKIREKLGIIEQEDEGPF